MPGDKYVLIIPDGAADVQRTGGLTPMAAASTPYQDWLAAVGVCGRMQTLYADLPRGSIVAQLGMLGWNPRDQHCHARSAWELLALGNVRLDPGDLVFRANLVRMEGSTLASYNAGFILSQRARPLIERLNAGLKEEFPEIELHHNCDFRNSLLVRRVGLDPLLFGGAEPHETEGEQFEAATLLSGRDGASRAVAARLNGYLVRAREILAGAEANMLFPWSPGSAPTLPSFRDNTGFAGDVAIVGCMDFLRGIAQLAGIDFFSVGNGRPDTDYERKGAQAVELLAAGYSFVICHINAPDEAAHMRDRRSKIRCLEAIDRHVVGPVLRYFQTRMDDLGGVMVAPDHYTNLLIEGTRAEAHSIDPVPFALWDGRRRDAVCRFDEDAVCAGLYGASPISHLDLLSVLGVVPRADRARLRPASLAAV